MGWPDLANQVREICCLAPTSLRKHPLSLVATNETQLGQSCLRFTVCLTCFWPKPYTQTYRNTPIKAEADLRRRERRLGHLHQVA